ITGHFPRTVHCDFHRRALASSQLETVLCTLHLNTYYEKICLFLWFWMLFVLIVSSVFVYIRILSSLRSTSEQQIRQLLKFAPESDLPYAIDRFLVSLGPDGIFVLQQIALNLGDLPASYLAAAMIACCEKSRGEGEKK
ncbi:hypothetical protein PENTCL1PPCAC_25537, partial [Pristionchus entomophagus]